jgi:N-acetylglucosaminyldiphosphoundecaprenol N-acetyl-beta-D-mannosaminyltransferase
MSLAERRFFTFRGVKLDNVNYRDICEILAQERHRKGYICFTDVGNVLNASKNPELKKAINYSRLSVVDGMPLAWFGWLSGCRNLERVSGPDFFARQLEESSNFSHFLLGDTQETIARIIFKAKERNPGLQIQGHSPPFREFTQEDNQDMLERIRAADPDLIWVSFGGGKQETWAHAHMESLKRGKMICVGAAFRFYIGEIVAPPRIVQRMGLQWLTRTLQHRSTEFSLPYRLFLQCKKIIKFFGYFPTELIHNISNNKMNKDIIH